MGLIVGIVFLVLEVCPIASSVVLQGSSGHEIPPSPVNFTTDDPIIEGSPHLVIQDEQMMSDPPSATSQPNPSPHFESASASQVFIGREPSLSPIIPLNEPPRAKEHVLSPDAAAQLAPSPEKLQQDQPPMSQEPPSTSTLAVSPSNLPVPMASSPSKLPRNPLPGSSTLPASPNLQGSAVPPLDTPASPAMSLSATSPPVWTTKPQVSPVLTPLPSINWGRDIVPASSSPDRRISSSPTHHSPGKAPSVLEASISHNHASPPDSSYKSATPAKSLPLPSLSPLYPPPPVPNDKPRHYAPSPTNPEPRASPASTPLPSINGGRDISPVSSSPNRTINVTSSQHIPVKAPSVHRAPSSNNHTHPNSSYMSTSPTKSHPSPSSSLLYHAPPPNLKSNPKLYVPPPPNSGSAVPPSHMSVSTAISPSATPPSIQTTTPSAHNAPLPDSNLQSPPTKSHPPPLSSPLYPPLPSHPPRHHASPPPNPAPVVAPPSTLPGKHQPIYHNSSIRPSNSPSPSVHNASSSHNCAPPPDSSYVSIPPTKSYNPPSLSPLYPPPPGPKSKPRHRGPPPPNPGSALPPFHTSVSPAISPPATSVQTISPKISPLQSSPSIPKPIQALPPPPPNEDCSSITCDELLTNTPPGTPCDCVMPMQIGLGLSVALYTFFPSVSELAFEIASGVFMKPSQVRIMGANADDQDPEKTIALIDLVPFGKRFDSFTAYQTAQRFWLKQVPIMSSLFGDYEVLYVKYPGLPPSPPMPSSNSGMNGEQDGYGNDGISRKPLGVDVSKHRHGNNLNGRIVAVISVSAGVAAILFCVVVWLLLFKRRDGSQLVTAPPDALPSFTKSSGIAGSMRGSGPTTDSLPCQSSIACTGSAKTFSSNDMEKATNYFNESQVLGEGGFGRVYSGLLDDGTKVAIKVLKRLGSQGGREFLAEVEMLSRLHHRNLVRLIGFCTDEKNRCLVYELIPNGSVESHLHGKDKETGPLDWAARLKIALGAARGLAYLHEDSSPRVIHRDFKASNILLEHDSTPKVSDFGLARTAVDEENRHITTRVMGTFGYVAPEYAMTGHLLVKSDVYSYGVVLLELLTGRKPVDMSRTPGQENLVTWAQPLLATPDGLPLLIDPVLSPDAPFDSVAKVAAIASMCVQTEVSDRPFMGEVVQALRLVCNECEETTELGSTPVGFDSQVCLAQSTYSTHEFPLDLESGCLVSGLGTDSGSYRMRSSSGQLTTGDG